MKVFLGKVWTIWKTKVPLMYSKLYSASMNLSQHFVAVRLVVNSYSVYEFRTFYDVVNYTLIQIKNR